MAEAIPELNGRSNFASYLPFAESAPMAAARSW